jgi:1,4-alpha-glucan branching enzyme
MYQDFGPRLDGGKVEFKLFLPDRTVDSTQYVRGGEPHIQDVRIVGEFQKALGGTNWDTASAPIMQKGTHPNGVLYTFKTPKALPDGFYQYKFFVTFEDGTTRYVSDPCAKYGGSDQSNENSAFVVGGNLAAAQPIANRLPLKDLIIYEMMIDDFTAEFRGTRAPLDAIHDKLDYLEDLGVNAIECMPWTPWPGGGFSWGYDVKDFFAVEYRYVHDPAAPLDKLHKLREFINACHARGIHVVMDGVFNHVRAGNNPNRGFAYRWLYQEPDDSPFIGAFARGGFFDEFDYDNKCVQEFIRDVCIYWIDTFRIDGIRFDFSLGFYVEGDAEHGITKLVSDVKAHLAATATGNVSLILEHLTDDRFESIDDTNKADASGNWLDPFMFKHFEYARNGNIDMDLLRILDANMHYATGKAPVIYVQNHDHSSYVHEAGGRGRWFKTQPGAIALLTSPGAVMIHNGQEFGQDEFLPNSDPGRVIPRPLRWNTLSPESGDFVGGRLFNVYAHLIRIRKVHPSLRSPNFFPHLFNQEDVYGVFPDQDVAVYHRYGQAADGQSERFIVVICYSDFDQRVTIPFSDNGRWDDLLNGGFAMVSGFRLFNQKINSNWGRIYYKKG